MLGFDPKLSEKPIPQSPTAPEINGSPNIVVSSAHEPDVALQQQNLESEDDGISLSLALTGSGGDAVVKCLILDLSYCSFADNDGVTALQQLYKSLEQMHIKLFLSNCNGKCHEILLIITLCRLPERVRLLSWRHKYILKVQWAVFHPTYFGLCLENKVYDVQTFSIGLPRLKLRSCLVENAVQLLMRRAQSVAWSYIIHYLISLICHVNRPCLPCSERSLTRGSTSMLSR